MKKNNRLVRRPRPQALAARPQWSSRLESKALSARETHPVVRASCLWNVLSEQLKMVLGETVHRQWFAPVRPKVISDQTLVLEVPNHFAAQWINHHYQELVDLLLSVHDKNLSCLFISHKDMVQVGDRRPLIETENLSTEI